MLSISIGVFCLGLFIAVSTISMVVHCWDPIPILDQWDSLISTRTVTWTWLMAPFGEHRILFPRLVFWLDYCFSRENNVVNFSANVLSQASLAALIGFLSKKSLARVPLIALWAFGVAASFLFSAVQFENFNWGFQIQFFGVLLAATASFTLLAVGPATIVVTGAAIATEVIAVYTLSSGVLVPVLGACLAIWMKRPRGQLFFLAAAAILLPLLYLVGYQTPSTHADPGQILAHFPAVLFHFLVQLGGPFAAIAIQPDPSVAAVIGAVGLAIFAFVIQVIIRRSPANQERALISVGVFVLAQASLTAAGRVSFGPGQALASRYATPVLLFWLITLLLCAGRLQAARGGPGLVAAVSLAACAWLAWTQPYFVDRGTHWSWERQIAKPALLANVLDPNIRFVYPDEALALRTRALLLQSQTSIFAESWTRLLGASFSDNFELSKDARCRGAFLKAVPLAGGGAAWQGFGRAWLSGPDTTLRRIVIADRQDRIVGYGWGGFDAAFLKEPSRTSSGPDHDWWIGDFSGTDPESFDAYALEPDGHKVCHLRRSDNLVGGPIAAPLPKELPELGGFVEGVEFERSLISIHGWALATDDDSKIFVDTDLPVRTMQLKLSARSDVTAAFGDDALGRSGFTVELELAHAVDQLAGTRLCIWSEDKKYGRRLLADIRNTGLCPAASRKAG